eukprot:PhM_4_TR15148/c0_g1_i1/m.18865
MNILKTTLDDLTNEVRLATIRVNNLRALCGDLTASVNDVESSALEERRRFEEERDELRSRLAVLTEQNNALRPTHRNTTTAAMAKGQDHADGEEVHWPVPSPKPVKGTYSPNNDDPSVAPPRLSTGSNGGGNVMRSVRYSRGTPTTTTTTTTTTSSSSGNPSRSHRDAKPTQLAKAQSMVLRRRDYYI